MKRVFLLSAALTAALMASCSHPESSKVTNDTTDETNFLALVDTPQITAPPAELKLDPFYKKYMNVNGIHVVSSWRVPFNQLVEFVLSDNFRLRLTCQNQDFLAVAVDMELAAAYHCSDFFILLYDFPYRIICTFRLEQLLLKVRTHIGSINGHHGCHSISFQ